MHLPEQKLKEILLQSAVISEDEFENAKEISIRLGQHLLDVLIGNGSVSESYLTEILEPYLGAPLVRLKEVTIPNEVLLKVPEALAKSKQAVAYAEDKENHLIRVAMVDPLDLDTVEFLRARLGVWV